MHKGGLAPNLSKYGRRYSSHAVSRLSSAIAGWWQKRFTLRGRTERSRTAAIILLASSAFDAPSPIEPSAPALDTAAAIAGEATPAIGAWMIGRSMPSISSSHIYCRHKAKLAVL